MSLVQTPPDTHPAVRPRCGPRPRPQRAFAGPAHPLLTGLLLAVPLDSVQPAQFDLTLGLRWPAQHLTVGARADFIAAQNRVPVGVETSAAYDLCDLLLTWEPPMIAGQALRIDLRVNNLTDPAFQPYLSAIDGPGRNLKANLAWGF